MNFKQNIILITILFAAVVFTACQDSFLDQTAKGSLGEDVLANQQGAEALLIGTYGALNGANISGNPWETGPSGWVFGSIVGGDAHKGSDAGDQAAVNILASFQTTSSTGYLNNKWTALYEGVSRANATINLVNSIPDEDIDEADRSRILAEARFLRGHFYFDLRRMFYRVPYIDENIDVADLNDVKQPNDSEIWDKIEDDFDFAYQNLPEMQSDVARANSWAAGAYLAKTYVFQEKWDEAKALYDVIIAQGQTASGVAYDLEPNFYDVFDPTNDTHSGDVFSVKQVQSDGSGGMANSNDELKLTYPSGGNSPFGCCGFFQPTHDLVNSYRTGADGLPLIANGVDYNDPDEMVTSDYELGSSDPFEVFDGSVDPRLDWTAGRRGVAFHDWGPFTGNNWLRDQLYSGPYSAKKHIWFQRDNDAVQNTTSWAPGSSYNIPIIRFADVLLMAAEAEVEASNGSLTTALEYVNRVRERAANPDGWVQSNEWNSIHAAAVVDNEADMLATEVTSFDWVVRTDVDATFVFRGGDSDDISNWDEYPEPNYVIEQYTAFTGAEQARELIRHERKLELAMEGHRFFDLVRWGIAAETLNAFMAYEGGLVPPSYLNNGNFTEGRNEYYPIPQNQIDDTRIGGEPTLTQPLY